MGGARSGDAVCLDGGDKRGVADEGQPLVEWETCGHDFHLTIIHWRDARDFHVSELLVLLDDGSCLGEDPTPRPFLWHGPASEEAGLGASCEMVTIGVQFCSAPTKPLSEGEAEAETASEDDVEAERLQLSLLTYLLTYL